MNSLLLRWTSHFYDGFAAGSGEFTLAFRGIRLLCPSFPLRVFALVAHIDRFAGSSPSRFWSFPLPPSLCFFHIGIIIVVCVSILVVALFVLLLGWRGFFWILQQACALRHIRTLTWTPYMV